MPVGRRILEIYQLCIMNFFRQYLSSIRVPLSMVQRLVTNQRFEESSLA